MNSDYLIFKIFILSIVVIILFISFYFLVKILNKLKIGHPLINEQESVDKINYHFNQIEEYKKLEEKYIQKLEEVKNKINILNKDYESGIFLKKNSEIWVILKRLFQDLNNWKRTKKYPITEEDVDFFLNDIEETFNVIGVELITPKVDEIFDDKEMKAVDVISNTYKDNCVAEIIKPGYKIKLKNRYKVLQEAEVIIYKNKRS